MKLAELFENSKTRSALCGILYVIIAATAAIDVVSTRHGHFEWDAIPGFGAIYGFVSAIVVIFVAGLLVKLGFRKPEDYYG